MPHIDILYRQIQLTYTDPVRTKKDVETFLTEINKEREKMNSVKTAVDQMPLQRKRARHEEGGHGNRTIAAKEVCDVISTQIKVRFSFTSHYSAAVSYTHLDVYKRQGVGGTDTTVDCRCYKEH